MRAQLSKSLRVGLASDLAREEPSYLSCRTMRGEDGLTTVRDLRSWESTSVLCKSTKLLTRTPHRGKGRQVPA